MGNKEERNNQTRLVRYTSRLLLTTTVTLGAASWHASGQFLKPRREALHYDLKVLALPRGGITLERTKMTEQSGIWGLEWSGGYGQIGRLVATQPGEVVRDFRLLRGTLHVGELVTLDRWAFPGDPAEAFGLPFSNVKIRSELGPLPAWYVKGPRDTWVIFVHGRDASRREALRMLRPVSSLGFPSLVITYRNDPEAPQSPDGRYHLGETEWKDVESAAAYALIHGARHLVVAGFSMGGAIVSDFLYRSPQAIAVRGVILDAPVLDWGATVNFVGRAHRIPGPLMSLTKTVFSIRFRSDWGALDEMGRATPRSQVLLFHGAADDTVPVRTSDAYAAAYPSQVTYARVAAAGHVESWNLDPTRYDAAVQAFVTRIDA
jgi:pimeloyl-ACP methyl ester carboxylesterase